MEVATDFIPPALRRAVQLRTTKVDKFVDPFIETDRDFLGLRKPLESTGNE